jgi:hypothetical protein
MKLINLETEQVVELDDARNFLKEIPDPKNWVSEKEFGRSKAAQEAKTPAADAGSTVAASTGEAK